MIFKKFCKTIAGLFGLQVLLKSSWENIREDWTRAQIRSNQFANLERIVNLTPMNSLSRIVHNTQYSTSQLGQDLWVLGNASKVGLFLEIGAFDGFNLSNTLLLERLGWKGFLVEPNFYPSQQERKALTLNVMIGTPGKVEFAITKQREFSTRLDLLNSDGLGPVRKNFEVRTVESISVEQLLRHLNSPSHIDYVSIDTEGNELEILRQWNFKDCDVDFWTVETNNRLDQFEIDSIMAKEGYCYIENHSGFDRWYTRHKNKSCLNYHRITQT
jgi:FkbM family methyltransferase